MKEQHVWFAVVVCLTTLLLSVVGGYMYSTKKFVEGGYCSSALPGHTDMAWTHCE